MNTAQMTVDSDPVELTGLDTGGIEGSSITLFPAGDLFVGASNVSAETGFLIPAGSSLSLDLGRGEKIYGIADVQTTVYVLRSGV